jgi:hypothetical protein
VQLKGAVSQYEVLRNAACGCALPPEARCGLVLLLRRGMWAWARFVSVLSANVQQAQATSPRFAATDESRTAVYVLAAMAMNTGREGAML